MKSITLPAIFEIIVGVFNYCNNLEEVYYLGEYDPPYAMRIFENTNVDTVYVLPTYKNSSFKGIPVSLFPKSDFFSPFFTNSETFSNSNEFTISNTFSSSNAFITPTEIVTTIIDSRLYTYSISFLITYVKRRSVSFSFSFYLSNTLIMSFIIEEQTYSYVISNTHFDRYFPYIIQYLSPSFTQTYILRNLDKVKRISGEQLIGIVCGSTSVFFLILGIIIIVIQKKYENQFAFEEEDFEDSSDETYITNKKKIVNNVEESFDLSGVWF